MGYHEITLKLPTDYVDELLREEIEKRAEGQQFFLSDNTQKP